MKEEEAQKEHLKLFILKVNFFYEMKEGMSK